MISKCVACVFAAVALASCCASGTGCYAPMTGSQVAWDGLGPAPKETAMVRNSSRPKKGIAAGPIGDVPGEPRPQAKLEWEQQEAADRADEAKLAKQLKICRGCSPPPSRNDDATGSIPH